MMLGAPDAELLEEIKEAWENLVRERDHWQEVTTLRERTIGQLLEERDEARYWATRLYQVAKQSLKQSWMPSGAALQRHRCGPLTTR